MDLQTALDYLILGFQFFYLYQERTKTGRKQSGYKADTSLSDKDRNTSIENIETKKIPE